MKKFFLLVLLSSTVLFGDDLWNGVDYNLNSDEQKAAAKKTLSTLTLSGDEKVLDIGCGDGYLTSLIAEHVSDATGIDLSPSMIDFASDHYKNAHFRVLNAIDLDYDSQFDLVTSFTTLHWIPDQLAVLKGIERALREGGKMIVDMPTSLPKPMLQAVQERMASQKWSAYFEDFSPGWRFFSAGEYEELLEEAHLQPSKIVQIPVPHIFPSKQAFMGFLKQWFPYLRPLPQDQKLVFLEEVVDRYLELMPPEKTGHPLFIVNRLRVEATK